MNHATHVTPAGPFTVLADEDGLVHAAGWTADPLELVAVMASSLRPARLRARRDAGAASRALHAYLAGDLAAIDAIATRQASGRLVERGWRELRTVAPGAPISYAELAARCGRPDAVRAAAAACGRNAAALYIPCHRVVRSTGALGGFRWGLDVKRALLAHEARWAQAA
jgi:methylated-DNA-[protein]-cysteine S-methyltransferase